MKVWCLHNVFYKFNVLPMEMTHSVRTELGRNCGRASERVYGSGGISRRIRRSGARHVFRFCAQLCYRGPSRERDEALAVGLPTALPRVGVLDRMALMWQALRRFREFRAYAPSAFSSILLSASTHSTPSENMKRALLVATALEPPRRCLVYRWSTRSLALLFRVARRPGSLEGEYGSVSDDSSSLRARSFTSVRLIARSRSRAPR